MEPEYNTDEMYAIVLKRREKEYSNKYELTTNRCPWYKAIILYDKWQKIAQRLRGLRVIDLHIFALDIKQKLLMNRVDADHC